jgi:hypothetical protein
MYYYYTHTYNTLTHMHDAAATATAAAKRAATRKCKTKNRARFSFISPRAARDGLFMSLLLYLSNARDFYIYIAHTHIMQQQQQWEKTHARRQLTLIYARRGELGPRRSLIIIMQRFSQPNGMHGRYACAHTPFIWNNNNHIAVRV